MKQSEIPEKLIFEIFEQPLVYRRECTSEKYWILYRPPEKK